MESLKLQEFKSEIVDNPTLEREEKRKEKKVIKRKYQKFNIKKRNEDSWTQLNYQKNCND